MDFLSDLRDLVMKHQTFDFFIVLDSPTLQMQFLMNIDDLSGNMHAVEGGKGSFLHESIGKPRVGPRFLNIRFWVCS